MTLARAINTGERAGTLAGTTLARTLVRTLVRTLAACCACACARAGAGATAAAVDAYDQGRYPEALTALRQVERARGTEVVRDARYALYRGLSELAVGNAPAAHRWLSVAKEAVAREPEALARTDRGRLEAAWRTLGKMPAQLR